MTMRYVNRFLAVFRQNAKTVGLSPKVLGPVIGGIIAAAAKLIGLDSNELAGVIGVVAASIAAVLLPPGDVVAPSVTEAGSDALMPPHIQEKLAN
jgi:hypothetical protein